MQKSIMFSAVILLLTASMTYSQGDIRSDTKFNASGKYSMNTEEKDALKNNLNTGKEIPKYLYEQLAKAQEDGNIEEENRIMNILISKYNIGIKDNNFSRSIFGNEILYDGNKTPLYNPDWINDDILVFDSTNVNNINTPRTFDIKMGPDGNIYIAYCRNWPHTNSPWDFKIVRSTDGGITWESGLYMGVTNKVVTSVSMLIERTHSTIEDSTRVNVFYIAASNFNNDSAELKFLSYNPNVFGQYVIKTIAIPAPGKELNFPTAFSNGKFYTASTDIGCVVGEYDITGSTLIALRYLYMSNWSWNFTDTRFLTGYNDFYPSAAYKDVNGTDSVFIAVERRFGTSSQIRLIKTTFAPSPSFSTTYLTSGSYNYEKPVLNIVQNKWACNKMIITCTRDNVAKYHYSINGGAAWNIDLGLDSRILASNTTLYTGVSTDTNTSGNDYCVGIYADQDSINVRRGMLGNLGATNYKHNSYTVSELAFPVCLVYNNGSNYRSAFSYWGDGPDSLSRRIYFDGEHLPYSVTYHYIPVYLYYKFPYIGMDTAENRAIPGVGFSWAPIHGLSIGGNGQFDNALQGNGGSSSTNYLNTGWATDIGTSSWTISMWLNNLHSTTALNYLFGDPTAGSFRCFYSGAAGVHGVMLRLSGVRGNDITVPGVGPGPTVLTFVYDSAASVVHAYKNGVLSNSQPQTSPLNINGSGPFKVGGYGSSASMPASSLLDEFRFYDEALDSIDIARTWNQTLPLITNIKPELNNTPEKYTLSQNYPNPFNPVTKIKYTIPISGLVTLKVYDILGREIATLVDEVKNSGNYIIDFNGSSLSSGVYFYRMEASDFSCVKKMLFVK